VLGAGTVAAGSSLLNPSCLPSLISGQLARTVIRVLIWVITIVFFRATILQKKVFFQRRLNLAKPYC